MASAGAGAESPSPYIVLLAVSIGMLMSVLDSTIVNVAIAKLQVSLGASTDAVQWVITAYLLVFAIVLTASGWLADNWGYKRTFLLALALFTFGSFLCSVSGNLTMLVVARVVQGAGGGLLGPVGMAIVTRSFPREKLGTVMALFSIPGLACTSFGPTLGGWLIDNFSWQTMFDINVPIGILGLILCSAVLRERRGAWRTSFDLPCFISLGLSMASLLFALSNGNASWNTDGWGSDLMLGCFAASFVLFALFVVLQATARAPMIDVSLFGNYNFSLSMAVIFVFGLGVFGSDFLLPLYLQNGLGYTPTQAGMIFLPFGLVMIVGGVAGGRLTDRIGPRIPGILGLALRAYGMYRFTLLTQYSGEGDILATVWLLGGGMGLLMSPMQSVAIAAIPPERTAQATSLLQIFRQLGGSFGVAILSTILVDREKFHLAALGEGMSSAGAAFKEAASRLLYHALAAGGGTMGEAANRAQSMIASEAAKASFVAAIDDVYYIAMIVSIVSSLPFFFIKVDPRRKASEKGAAGPALE
jgi:MFS transporter, DHA2 family, multidrug resistance protein